MVRAMVRTIAIAIILFAAGCADTNRANAVRRICVDNGHALGSPGFDACFRDTFAAASHSVSGRR